MKKQSIEYENAKSYLKSRRTRTSMRRRNKVMESIDNAIFGSILEKLSRGRCLDDVTVTMAYPDPASSHTLGTLVEEEGIEEDEDIISAKWIWAAGSYLEDEDDERWEACLQ
jgi:hypothetical protein